MLKDDLLKLAELNRLFDADESYPQNLADEMIVLRRSVIVEIEKQCGSLLQLMVNARILRTYAMDELGFWDGFIDEVDFNKGNEGMVDFRINESCRFAGSLPNVFQQ